MTIIYNVSAGGSAVALASGGFVRAGMELSATSALIGSTVAILTCSLKKSGAPLGNITAVVRNAADSVVATSVEAIDSTTLTTSYLTYTFTFASPPTLAADYHVLIEYAGDAFVSVDTSTTDQFDTSNTMRARYSIVYTTTTTSDLVATIDDTAAGGDIVGVGGPFPTGRAFGGKFGNRFGFPTFGA